ncbi:MAG TPA: CRTAC1 family protein, partial [Thermoanaerobaculia bacterium]|nr:CRTAC1 family protein [Thermoanaerobaculia bacterium]
RSYCERLVGSDDPYFGRAQVPAGLRRLEQDLDPGSEVRVRLQLAYEHIRLGEHEQAITQARAVLDLLRKAGQDGSPAALGAWKVLGVANYQAGEDANCVTLHPEGACILPIRPGAVHARPEHARDAAEAFLEVLRRRPDDVSARWLLNLSSMVSGDYPQGVPEPLRLPPGAFATPADATPFPLWIDVAPRLGVAAFDLAGGAVMDDFDGDGRLDLISSTWDPCDSLKAFRNDGEGGFVDVTEAWGLHGQLGGLNLVHADFDNDGDLDLLVLRGAWQGPAGRVRRSLLRNDLNTERRSFVDVTAAAGLAYPAYPSQAAAWADYDGDGDLDLYIGTEADQLVVDPSDVREGLAFGHPAHLFRNNGDGTFTDVAAAAGVQDRGFTKGVAWGDFDNDGHEDLFLSNFGPNRLYRNRGDGTFEDVTLQAGVAGGSRRNFATWFFDYDNDGDLDLFVSSFHGPAENVAAWYFGIELRSPPAPGKPSEVIRSNPFLYRNDGGGRFTEVSEASGLGAPLLVMGSNFGDLDGDGWLDLYLGTGQPDFAALHPNVFYRNVRGERFEDLTFRSGLGHLQKGHGVAFGDLDGDGDEDLFQQLGGAFPYDKYGNALYLNPSLGGAASPNQPSWLVLRLRGVRANRFGVGARVRVDVVDAAGARRSIHRRVDTGGSFGGSSHQLEVGLGDARTVERLEIRWPGSGTVDRFEGVALDRYYEAVEGAENLRPLDVKPLELRMRPVHHDH